MQAEVKLEVIKNETGISLWYIEAMFLLYEYTGQSKKQKEFLSEINEQNKLGVISTLAYFLNQRTERTAKNEGFLKWEIKNKKSALREFFIEGQI